MSINEKLNDFVKEKGIKQIFISEKTGIPADTISKILRNGRKMTAEEFLVICSSLEIDPNMFRESA